MKGSVLFVAWYNYDRINSYNATLNFILTSHCWQQDHNGFTHQDPGFLNHLVTKKADVTRIYLTFDANTLLSCADHVLRTKNYINLIGSFDHMEAEAKEKDLLDKIQEI